MPTYAQLQTEPYWGREVVTEELDWLGDELCRRAGRPRAAFGSKGNNLHLRGAHRSQEWIKRSRYCTNRSYTVQSGLTAEQERHIAGADFTPGEWGSAENRRRMVEQTRRLVAALKSGRLVGVREVIGTLDGRTVVGTRPDGSTFSSDDSHLEHWHLTLDRRHCRDQQLMARILAIALGDTVEGDDMFCKLGDEGERVQALQVLLQQAGFPPEGGADGKYGAATSAALLKARQSLGSQAPSGDTYDAHAYAQLMTVLAKRYAGDRGPQGPAGPQGPKGDQGEPGPQGPAGDVDATEVLRRMGEMLTAGTTAQG